MSPLGWIHRGLFACWVTTGENNSDSAAPHRVLLAFLQSCLQAVPNAFKNSNLFFITVLTFSLKHFSSSFVLLPTSGPLIFFFSDSPCVSWETVWQVEGKCETSVCSCSHQLCAESPPTASQNQFWKTRRRHSPPPLPLPVHLADLSQTRFICGTLGWHTSRNCKKYK